MLTLRTPDERFTGLPDFDHQPGFAQVSDGAGGRLRIGYVAAGPPGGQVRFARVVAANTGLPTGDVDMPEVWWRVRRAVAGPELARGVVEFAAHRG